MELVKQTLIDIWLNDILKRVRNGLITYERQLQAEIYFNLKSKLPQDYKVWIEPVIYNLDKIKPDIIITNEDRVLSIIELKFKPWEYPDYQYDLNKFLSFESKSNNNLNIDFGYIPISSDWRIQQGKGTKLSYRLTQDYINCFILFGKKDSAAFNLANNKLPGNFLHLFGYIDNIEGEVNLEFKKDFYLSNQIV